MLCSRRNAPQVSCIRRQRPDPSPQPVGPTWVPDDEATHCHSCHFVFSFLIRRHHCRHCGNIFCRYCCSEFRSIPKFEFVQPVRVCLKCSMALYKAEALVVAILNHDLSVVQRYCKKHDPNFYNGVFPPLTLASAQGYSDIVELLIAQKADVNHAVPATSLSVLVQCPFCLKTSPHDVSKNQMYKCPSCQETTKAAKTSETIMGNHIGVTPLHAAVQMRGHADVVRLLLEARAEPEARTSEGKTPLFMASGGGHLECAKLLVDAGADVNAPTDIDGDRPLHRAVREGKTAMVAQLLRYRASRDVKNHEGLTPLALADKLKHADIIFTFGDASCALLDTAPPPTRPKSPQPEPVTPPAFAQVEAQQTAQTATARAAALQALKGVGEGEGLVSNAQDTAEPHDDTAMHNSADNPVHSMEKDNNEDNNEKDSTEDTSKSGEEVGGDEISL